MTAGAQTPSAIGIGVVVVIALTGWALALRWRAQAVRDRLALRLALEREGAFVEAARRLADAARLSIDAVREEMERAVRAIAPGIDAVLFFEEADARLVCVAASGSRVAYFAGMQVALDDDSGLLVQALRCGHRVSSLDAPAARPLHPGDAFAAAIPLVLDAGRRCALYVGGDRADDAAVADRIVRLVDQATPAYRIALDRADDRVRAEYDGLTGLLTARTFRLRLAQLTAAARCGSRGRLGLLFIDTDRFKAWNDTYGHASGDALLRQLADVLRAAATDRGDIVARNGGDEFCIVFIDTEKSRAIERAEQLRARIAAADFTALQLPVSGRAAVRISASIGVACFPADAQSPSALLEKADAAMYHSKRTGRDAVSYFGVDGTLCTAGPAPAARTVERRQDES